MEPSMSQAEVLVVIGQIGAGKSSVCRELALETRAEHIAIEDLQRPDGTRLGAHELSRRIASAAARGAVVFECSGASRDFEDVIEHLRLRGLGCFVALIDCSIQTALRRVRESKIRTKPRSGASWAAQLRWTESRLRLVPADVTISSENSHPNTIAKDVGRAWSEAQSNPPAKSMACRELSFTQVAAFAVCPWSYRLKYVDRLQETVETEQMHLGSRLHEALAYLYGGPDRDKDGLTSWFRNRLAETVPDGVERQVVDRMLRTGLKALAYHYDVVYREERSNTLAVEQIVRLPLSAEQTLVGRVDRVARDASGTVEVIDYKMSEPRGTSRPRVPDWLQIAAYSASVLRELDLRSVIARRIMLATGDEERFLVAAEDVRQVRLSLLRWAKALTPPRLMQKRIGRHCASCQFNTRCSGASAYPPRSSALVSTMVGQPDPD